MCRPLAVLLVAMELRIPEHPEPSHIHIPRPSQHSARGSVQVHSSCPADVCVRFVDQLLDERSSIDTD